MWLVNSAVERIAMLIDWGRFEASLEAISAFEALGDEMANEYGLMWIHYAKACALHQLARTAEAEQVLEESILPGAQDNQRALTGTLLCLNKLDEAADTIIERLGDDVEKYAAMATFVEAKLPETMPSFRREMHERKVLVNERSEVRKAFKKVGRVVEVDGLMGPWATF
jgi:hypothetical protein